MSTFKNIIIYDGSQSTLIERGEFEFTGEQISRDLTQLASTTIKVIDELGIISAWDTFHIPMYAGLEFAGRIAKIEDDGSGIFKTLTLVFGADTYKNDVLLIMNSLSNFSITENNFQALTLQVDSTSAVTSNDKILEFDVLARQSMRRSHKREDTQSASKILISEVSEQTYFFRLDDPSVLESKTVIASDTFNALTLYNSDNMTQYIDYYMRPDGSITKIASEGIRPVIPNYEVTDSFNYANIGYAEDKFKQQSYNNSIEATVLIDNNMTPLNFNNTFLGRHVNVIMLNNQQIESMITAYSFINEYTIKITFGLSRTRYTEQQKSEV